MKTARFALAGILVMLLAGTATATSYVMVADEDLTDSADGIALVRALGSRVVEIDGRIWTEYEVVPQRVLKGSLPAPFRVRTLGGVLEDGRALWMFDSPGLGAGQEALIFLHRRADGSWGFKHLELGLFRVDQVGERRVAHRTLGGATVDFQSDDPLRSRRSASLAKAHRARDLDGFLAWIDGRVAGTEQLGDYYLEEDFLDGIALPKFNLIALSDGNFFHWHELAPGVGGSVTMLMYKKGLKGLKGKGKKVAQNVMKAWSKIFNISLVYGGKSKAAKGGFSADELNAVHYKDPNDEIDGSFSCSQGGVLARAGATGFLTGPAHSATGSGGNRRYWHAQEGDMVFQDGIECSFVANRRTNDIYVGEIAAHEQGHILGLGHSCGENHPDVSDCDTTEKDEAIMRAFVHADGRGPRIGKDDKDGAKALDYDNAGRRQR